MLDVSSNAPQRRFMSPRVVNALLFLAVFVFMCTFIEVLFWLLTPEETYYTTQARSYLKFHPITGYDINDDGVYTRIYHFVDDTPSIHVTATLKDGLRYTPMTQDNREQFALFFGDSFTFGEGVNDNETLPFYFGEFAHTYRPYNFGVPSGSVQNMYYKLASNEVTTTVHEESGLAFYFFLGFHTNRVVGGMPAFNKWADRTACYELVDDKIAYMGTFRSAHPYRSILYDMLYLSNTCRYTRFFLPLKHSEGDYELTARILQESIRLFKQQFPHGQFIVMFWDDRVPYMPVKNRIEGNGVKTVLVRDFLLGIDNPLESKQVLPDGHIKAQVYKQIAQRLYDSLITPPGDSTMPDKRTDGAPT